MDREDFVPPHFCGLLRLSCVVFALLCMRPGSALSQAASPDAILRGLSLGLEGAHTSAWNVELSPPNAPRSTISEATGLALIVSYGVTPWLAPWISYTASLYGDSDPSAVSELAGGLEFRGQWFKRLVPSVGLGLGSTSAPTAGGFSFTHADVAANAAFFVSRRVAFRAGVHALLPVGEASGSSNSGDTSFDVSDGRTQLRLGMTVHLGPSQ
jgi:hypothetical protein